MCFKNPSQFLKRESKDLVFFYTLLQGKNRFEMCIVYLVGGLAPASDECQHFFPLTPLPLTKSFAM
jgi:hypothetical protein